MIKSFINLCLWMTWSVQQHNKGKSSLCGFGPKRCGQRCVQPCWVQLGPRKGQHKLTRSNLWFQQRPHSEPGQDDLWGWPRWTLKPGFNHNKQSFSGWGPNVCFEKCVTWNEEHKHPSEAQKQIKHTAMDIGLGCSSFCPTHLDLITMNSLIKALNTVK